MPESKVYNMDCIEYMATVSDNYFDLVIADPPYGFEDITTRKEKKINTGNKFAVRYNGKDWNNKTPTAEYWEQIFRVSKNQIVFGANYFTEFLPVSRGWAYWHKQGEKMSSVNDELIWTSFDVQIKMFSRCHGMDKGFMADHNVFHPTTKPVKLYEWILKNYAEEGQTILDTHLGSGSSRIAADKAGLDFTGIEIDKEYFDLSEKRFKQYKSQLRIEGW